MRSRISVYHVSLRVPRKNLFRNTLCKIYVCMCRCQMFFALYAYYMCTGWFKTCRDCLELLASPAQNKCSSTKFVCIFSYNSQFFSSVSVALEVSAELTIRMEAKGQSREFRVFSMQDVFVGSMWEEEASRNNEGKTVENVISMARGKKEK